MTNPFHFKQFTIQQDKAAMKVGTDSVLLGAWAMVETAQNILDIGSGTGLLSLMAAQRNAKANIIAIDIDEMAFEQARENVSNSDWATRIKVLHISIQEFQNTSKAIFDHILCNPPYFKATAKHINNSRIAARQNIHFSISDLATAAGKLLTEKGVISVVYPYENKQAVVGAFKKQELPLQRCCEIRPTSSKPPKRILLQFGRQKIDQVICDQLTIEPTKRHHYSEKYMDLTKDFYLKKN